MKFRIALVGENLEYCDKLTHYLTPYFCVKHYANPQLLLTESDAAQVILLTEKLPNAHHKALLNNVDTTKSSPLILHLSQTGSRPQENITALSWPLANGNPGKLIKEIDEAIIRHHSLSSAAQRLSKPVIVSSVMQNLYHRGAQIATLSDPVLLTGATGTGKDVYARWLHEHSLRAGKLMHIVNCPAVVESLFDSEFFGNVRGAFTGAQRDRIGHFEKADHSTLVLDEIGELALSLQAKLLRVIENHEFFPVGSRKRRQVDVRIIAITNRDLQAEVSGGRFRSDLFHRLNAYHVHLPSLEHRAEDIGPLTEYFLKHTWLSLLPNWRKMLTPEVIDWLMQCQFGGNIRELRHLLLNTLLLLRPSDPILTTAHLAKVAQKQGLHSRRQPINGTLPTYLKIVERNVIVNVLRDNDANITYAAKELGITRQNLQQRMRKLKLSGNSEGG